MPHDVGFDHFHITPEDKAWMTDVIWSQENVELTTVGVDVGSSTSHLMFAKIQLQRLSEGLSSRFVVVNREILWRSPILLTPYRADNSIDADALKIFFDGAFESAGMRPDVVDTGAVILTGEALKRVNARAIADLFAEESGKFVCASAGHHLEALMAAHGSGAVVLSRQAENTVLNIDVGGGTVKLGLMQEGRLLATSAFAVGGRLGALDEAGRMVRIEEPAKTIGRDIGLTLTLGEPLDETDRKALVKRMVEVILTFANRAPKDDLCRKLALTEPLPETPEIEAVTFSGGVSEYIHQRETDDHGDLGRALAHEIRHQIGHKRLPYPIYDLEQGIRATVVGASQFSVQVSGNTIFISEPESLPIRNVPVAHLDLDLSGDFTSDAVRGAIAAALERLDFEEGGGAIAVAFAWAGDPLHARLFALAKGIHDAFPETVRAAEHPLVVVMDGDAGRTLGNILVRELDVPGEVISVDNVQLREFDYVDIGAMIPETRVVPLIIKSLLFAGPGGASA